MTLRLRFLLAAAASTLGCLSWWQSELNGPLMRPLALLLVAVVPNLLVSDATRPLRWPKWNNQAFFRGTSFVLGAALFVMLVYEPRLDDLDPLLLRWYFVGAAWLLLLSDLARRYLAAKESARASTVDRPLHA